MSVDLSAAVEAVREGWPGQHFTRDGALFEAQTVRDGGATARLIEYAVTTAAPLIAAQVRAQATRLEPWESIALTVASAQLDRGEEPGPNTAAVCIGALERIARGESA